MQLSKTEHEAYSLLRKNGFVLFRIKDICLLLSMSKTQAYNLVKALKKKNAITTVKGGSYTFKDSDELAAATAVAYPSYISFWSALHYYGWSDQTPHTIFIATPAYKKDLGSLKFVTLSNKRFFGYVKSGGITLAEKEKAIIDSLLFPKYSGGMHEIQTCLARAFSELDKAKLVHYALQCGSKAVARRLGYLLSGLGHKSPDALKKYLGKGYERLDPTLPKKNKLNKQWLLDINL